MVLILNGSLSAYKWPRLKPNSWTYKFVEVLGIVLRFSDLRFPYTIFTLQTSFKSFLLTGGGGGGIGGYRWLWIARRKILKTFDPITSKSSASEQDGCVFPFGESHSREIIFLCSTKYIYFSGKRTTLPSLYPSKKVVRVQCHHRWLWIARRKILKTFVPITSKKFGLSSLP